MMSRQTAVQWLTVLVTMILVVSAGAVFTRQQTQHALNESRRTSQESARQSLAVVCAAFIAQDEVLNDPDNPPTSERARNNARAWHALRVRFCQGF